MDINCFNIVYLIIILVYIVSVRQTTLFCMSTELAEQTWTYTKVLSTELRRIYGGIFMESFLHKHYKEHLLCKGMKILSCGEVLTVLDFETEVNLKKYFDLNWDKSIIVDILAKTDKGYVAIEVYNTNAKLWETLYPYYDDISDKVINFFEVKVSDVVNVLPVWRDRKLLLKESDHREFIDMNQKTGDFYFGVNSKPYKVNDNLYQIKCVHRLTTYSKYSEIVTMQFDLSNKYITENRLFNCFGNVPGIVKSNFTYLQISENLYQCISFYNPKKTGYSKYDQEMIMKIRRQLENMKPQNKIVYARKN